MLKKTPQFRHFLQPVVNLDSLDISHYEMLSRLQNGKTAFPIITKFEEHGLSPILDIASIRSAIGYINSEAIHYPIAVNVSASSLSSPEFYNSFKSSLELMRRPKSQLSIEITETQPLIQSRVSDDFFKHCRTNGLKIAADDFGTGHMNLSTLVKFPFDYVKLDGSIMVNAIKKPEYLSSVLNSIKHINSEVIIERVETKEEYELAKKAGISKGQGYFFGKPEPVSTIEYTTKMAL